MLIGKSLDTQKTFGNGFCGSDSTGASYLMGTGIMDSNGAFFGSNDRTNPIKIFGMENYWGNQARRIAGLISVDRAIKYKMTYGTEDGSEAEAYNTTAEGYLNSGVSKSQNVIGYLTKNLFNENGMFAYDSGGSGATFYCDSVYLGPNTNYAVRGGRFLDNLNVGAFMFFLFYDPTYKSYAFNASLSCKPLS